MKHGYWIYYHKGEYDWYSLDPVARNIKSRFKDYPTLSLAIL